MTVTLEMLTTMEGIRQAIRAEFAEGPAQNIALALVECAHSCGKVDGLKELAEARELRDMPVPTSRPQ
jgi:hypothetical protein